MQSIALNDGRQLPIFGLGTWRSKPGEVYDAVRAAFEAGYTHIDCAAIYGNEPEVGRALEDAIKAGDVTREALWVTSKLWNDHHAPADVAKALETTLRDLRLDAVDLYLIHWPVALKKNASFPFQSDAFLPLDDVPLAPTWQAMVDARERGHALSVGVSNMGPKRLAALTDAVGVTPAVDQVESHPFLPQRELVAYGAEHGVALTAYSPLGNPALRGENDPTLLGHPTICSIAERLDAGPGQVLIAWQIQRGVAVIPKSTNAGRIASNFAATGLALSEEDVAAIDALENGHRFVDGSFWCVDGNGYDLDTLWS